MASPIDRGLHDLPPPPDYSLLNNPKTAKEIVKHCHLFKPTNRPKRPGRGKFRPQVFTLEQKKLIKVYFGRMFKVRLYLIQIKINICRKRRSRNRIQFSSIAPTWLSLQSVSISLGYIATMISGETRTDILRPFRVYSRLSWKFFNSN